MNFTPVRPGAINQGGTKDALFLKVFSGEVFATFKTACVTLPLVRSRTITSGKSAQFIVTGRVTGSRHTPGTEIVGNDMNTAERTISIDRPFVVPNFLDNLEEIQAHWQVRQTISKEHGDALARQMDSTNLQVLVKAARATKTVTEGYDGTTVQDANAGTIAANLKTAIAAVARSFDQKDVPAENRYLIIRPAQHWLLHADGSITNRDYAGSGSIATGELPEYAGLKLIKSNRIPSTLIANGGTGEANDYGGDFAPTVAVGFVSDAIGVVSMMGVQTQTEPSVRHQGVLLVSRYASGTGILRPECAAEIRTSTPSA